MVALAHWWNTPNKISSWRNFLDSTGRMEPYASLAIGRKDLDLIIGGKVNHG
jgi:hypothetical protein